MLAVMKFAWVTLTICPGHRELKLIGAPKRFVKVVVFVTINLVWLFLLFGSSV